MTALSTEIIKIEYDAPLLNIPEIKRYAKIKSTGDIFSDEQVDNLINEMLDEILPKLSYRVAFRYMEKEKTIYFGATIGIEIDRIINKYGKTSPVRALIAQGIGAERIESLCDQFEEEVRSELSNTGLKAEKRVSPGYGDFILDSQKYIFEILDLPKKIGLTLNESLMMSPSKSVTGKIRIIEHMGDDFEMMEDCPKEHSSCISCSKVDCEYRK